jgi:hypothetical protein
MNKSKLCNLKTVVLASLLIYFGFMLVYSVFKSRVLEGNTTMGDAFNSGAGGASSDRAISTAGEVSKILATSDYKRGPPQVNYGQPTTTSTQPTTPQVITPINTNSTAAIDTGSNVTTVSAAQTFPY